MRKLARLLAALLSLTAAPALAQYPQTLPANSVVGRLGAGTAGPAQAIPFANLATAFAPYLAPLLTSTSVYDATVYGVRCNGTFDDTTYIAAAVTAASATGGIVQLPGKGAICRTSATIELPTGVILQGGGVAGATIGVTPTKWGTKILWIGAAGGTVIKFAESGYNMGVRDLYINGALLTPSAAGGVKGIHVQANTHIVIQDVSIEDVGYCFYFKGTTAGIARSSGAGSTLGRLNCQNSYVAWYFDGGTSGVDPAVTDFGIFGYYINTYYRAAVQFISNLDDIKFYDGWIQAQVSGAVGIDYNPNSVADNIAPTGTMFFGLTYGDVPGAIFVNCNSTGNVKSGGNIISAVFIGGAGSQTVNRNAGCILNINSQIEGTIETGTKIGTTASDGVTIQNPAAATVGAQQYSPRLRLTGAGWKTNATAASQVVDITLDNRPVQGAASPTPLLQLSYQVAGGGYSSMGYWTPNALNHVTGFQVAGGATSGNVLRGNGTTFVDATLQGSDLGGTTLASSIVTSSITTLGTNVNTIQLLTSAQLNWNGDAILTRAGAAQIQFGAADSATPVAQTITAQGVSTGTANTAGVNLNIAAGRSTGSADGGAINLRVSPAGGAGSSQNLYSTRFTVTGHGAIGAGLDLAPVYANALTISSNTKQAIDILGVDTRLILATADASQTQMVMASWGIANANVFTFYSADGTAASQTDTPTGREIGIFGWSGRGSSALVGNAARIIGVAAPSGATWTSSDKGIYFDFDTTPSGSATRARAVRVQASGGVSIGTTTDGGIGSLLANTSIKSQGATSGIGYATGAGGAVTQGTSRTTGVTLNTVSGAITLFSAAGSTTPASFTVTNSAVAATDTIIVNQKSGTDLYEVHVTAVGAGSFRISFWTTGGTTTEQPVFNFNVIKGVAS